MEALMLVVVLMGGLAGAGVWYSTQMKKNYLHELEKALELQKFQMSGSMGKATVEASWKGTRITIDALPSGPGLPSAIHYKMDSRSSFTADIRPGAGLAAEAAAAAAANKKGPKEEETLRPWRAKLTAEEEAMIKERAGEGGPETPKERFRITSPKPDEVGQFLSGKRNEELAGLFLEGCTMVQIGFAEVVAVKSPYTSADMSPRVVLKRLMRLKALRNEY